MKAPFPPWTNYVRPALAVGGLGGVVYAILIVTFGFSPMATDRGYAPEQPVKYSHRLHAGELGIDCRYCHNTVDRQTHAAVPATETCMGCHARIHTESAKLAMIRETYAANESVPWARIHDLPDYAYFDHSAHVLKGVGCESCHGRIDQMEVVYQSAPLSMGWCLECHRNPEPNLRPPDMVTVMGYEPESPDEGARIAAALNINPPEHCSGCHR